jgi:hypothetical protein
MTDPLPSNVLYYVNQIAGYSKNTAKLQNLNSTSAGPGAGASQTTVTMPTNAIINLKSLSLHCTYESTGVPAETGGANPQNNKAIYGLIPKGGISALVQKLSWSAGGIALDNGPTPYSVIYAVKNTTENSFDKMMSDQKVLNNSVIQPYDVQYDPNGTRKGNGADLICNEWYGFSESAPCFLDTNLLPELRLTIQWEGNNVIPIQYESGNGLGNPQAGTDATTGVCTYQLKDMFWTVDCVSFSNGLLDAMNERMMRDDGALDVVYPQYQVFSVDASGSTNSIRGGVSTMSLDRVYGLQRNSKVEAGKTLPKSYDQQQPPIQCADGAVGTNFNQAFTNFGALGVTEYQFKVNNTPYPMYREKLLGGYNSIVTSNARTYKHNEGSQIGSAKCWTDNFFTPMISLNHPSDQRFISGLDLRSINSQINWDIYGTGNTDSRQILMMTQQTSLMKIGGGRSLAVIA